MRKLLGIFAHPGDETYFSGGTFVKFIKNGGIVDLVCATRGKDEVHQSALETAAGVLGVRSVTFLDYKSGELPKQTPGEIEDKLTKLLTEYRPDIVVTYEPGGITNDPDHIKFTLATTFAFQKYAWDRKDADPEDQNDTKLYYTCLPETLASYLKKKKYIPYELFEKPITGVEDKHISAVIDIKRVASVKSKALSAYDNSELSGYSLLAQEYFILRFSGTVEAFMGKNDRITNRI